MTRPAANSRAAPRPPAKSHADEAEQLGQSLLALAAQLRDLAEPVVPPGFEAPAPACVAPSAPEVAAAGRMPDPKALARTVAGLQGLRQRRLHHLGLALAGEAAWDILLSLYEARLARRHLSFYQLCAAGGAYPATIRRWLGVLSSMGLVELTGADGDQGGQRAALTRKGERVMTDCLRALVLAG